MSVLKQKLKSGQCSIGSWISLADNAIAEIFAKIGFDWVVVDMEHSVLSMSQVGDLIRTLALSGTIPLVRLTSNNPDQIKRVLDAGAHGIVVPNVKSREDAENAVRASRYGPLGCRGVGLARAQGYGDDFDSYLEYQKNDLSVIVQIENVEALSSLKDIFETPGVDGFLVGPYDLSCSLGKPGDFSDCEFAETLNYILRMGKELGCPAGIHVVEPDTDAVAARIEEGYQIIAFSVDIRMLSWAASRCRGLMQS